MPHDDLNTNPQVERSSGRAIGLLFAVVLLVITGLSLFYEGFTTVVS